MPKTARSVAAKSPPRNDALWDFACALYAKPGIAQACLALQDEHGADVSLLLAAIWHGAAGRGVLSAARAGRWKKTARAWRTTVVRPLREARRALKTQDAASDLYAAVKRVELAAERRQLEALERDAAAHARQPQHTRRKDAGRKDAGRSDAGRSDVGFSDAQANARLVLQRGKDSQALLKIFSALREAP